MPSAREMMFRKKDEKQFVRRYEGHETPVETAKQEEGAGESDRFAPRSGNTKFIRFTASAALSRLSLSYLSLDGLLIISYEHVFLSSFSPFPFPGVRFPLLSERLGVDARGGSSERLLSCCPTFSQTGDSRTRSVLRTTFFTLLPLSTSSFPTSCETRAHPVSRCTPFPFSVIRLPLP